MSQVVIATQPFQQYSYRLVDKCLPWEQLLSQRQLCEISYGSPFLDPSPQPILLALNVGLPLYQWKLPSLLQFTFIID